MSLSRQFFRELRPLFRMLEEPFGRTPAFYGRPSRSIFDDPFLNSPSSWRPPIDVTEEGNNFVIEAELPGVKKENVEVRIGEGGRNLTTRGGRDFSASGQPNFSETQSEQTSSIPAEVGSNSKDVVNAHETSNAISTEREVSGTSAFRRSVWLPRPVDGSAVKAKLEDGILTVTVPKAEDKASVKIPVE
ncbi:HSP20-like chaperone [Neolentinus lepideus HHB14362 ss-1]|uniref:HSP20-like chaperone n=1 Tax=Neolentinus lepideus HHB14362 ss-1 TaxID=1314782 RepID=A0A165ND01_9AGAM|nr:HSP20-like chaperone [Neolentinus lepideus HHB14362 ss-1]